MIDDCNINNLAKNQVSAVFNSKCVIQIYRDLYGYAIQTGTNMAAWNQQQHLSLSFATKAYIYLSRNSKTLK